MRICFSHYAAASTAACILLLSHAWIHHETLYDFLVYLSSAKPSLAILNNFAFMWFLFTGRFLVKVFVGRLRDLEVEELMDSGRGFLTDTILFLVLSTPTIDGKEVPTVNLLKYIIFVVGLKMFHLISQIRVTHLFEIGVPRRDVIMRLLCLMVLLVLMDACAVAYFCGHSAKDSTFYVWVVFECLGMSATGSINILKFFVHCVDLNMENGWPARNALVFYLDLIHDVVSLTFFLMFMIVFFLNNPSRLPLYMIADILQVFRTLMQRIRSFQRYRQLTRNMQARFADATEEEILAAERCIICRDVLTTGAKKMPCNHIFHIDCVKSWFVQQQTCPTCRAEIPVADTSVEISPPNPEGDLNPHIPWAITAQNIIVLAPADNTAAGSTPEGGAAGDNNLERRGDEIQKFRERRSVGFAANGGKLVEAAAVDEKPKKRRRGEFFNELRYADDYDNVKDDGYRKEGEGNGRRKEKYQYRLRQSEHGVKGRGSREFTRGHGPFRRRRKGDGKKGGYGVSRYSVATSMDEIAESGKMVRTECGGASSRISTRGKGRGGTADGSFGVGARVSAAKESDGEDNNRLRRKRFRYPKFVVDEYGKDYDRSKSHWIQEVSFFNDEMESDRLGNWPHPTEGRSASRRGRERCRKQIMKTEDYPSAAFSCKNGRHVELSGREISLGSTKVGGGCNDGIIRNGESVLRKTPRNDTPKELGKRQSVHRKRTLHHRAAASRNIDSAKSEENSSVSEYFATPTRRRYVLSRALRKSKRRYRPLKRGWYEQSRSRLEEIERVVHRAYGMAEFFREQTLRSLERLRQLKEASSDVPDSSSKLIPNDEEWNKRVEDEWQFLSGMMTVPLVPPGGMRFGIPPQFGETPLPNSVLLSGGGGITKQREKEPTVTASNAAQVSDTVISQ